jgi:hypothetical protein
LEYAVLDNGYTVSDAEKSDLRKGDLMFIKYSIPDKIEKTMFVEEP